jgi:hypothetical protein
VELEMSDKKEMFGVEHCYSDGASTYDIFETLDDANTFCKNVDNWNNAHYPLFIFKADFNVDLIFKDDNNWNYDDFKGVILGNFKKIKIYNTESNLLNFVL